MSDGVSDGGDTGDDGPVRFMQQHIALDYAVRVSPLGAALRRPAPIGAHRGPAVPVVRPRVRAPAVVLPAVRRRHGPRGGGRARRLGHRHRLHGAHADPVPRAEGAGGLRAGQRPDRRRRRHRRPAAAHRRAPRPDPHGHAGRGGVGPRGASAGPSRAIGASPSPTPSGVGAPPASPTCPPRTSRSTCSDGARRRHRLLRAGAVHGPTSRRRSRSCSSRSIDEAIERSGIDRREIGFTCSGSADYLAGAVVRVRRQPRGHRRLAADLGEPRGDGRRVGALRGLGAAPARRHRLRPRVLLGHLLARRAPRGPLPPERSLLPDAAVGRPRVARRAPGAGAARRGGRHRGRPRRGGRPQPPQRPRQPVRAGPRRRHGRGHARRAATSWRRSAPATARRCPTAPRRWSSWPATGPARCASGRRGSEGSTTASSRTTRACATSPRASRRGSPASTSGVGDAPDRGGGAVGHLQPRGADPARPPSGWATTSRSTRPAARWRPTPSW